MTDRQHPAAHADDETQTQVVGAAALDFTMVVTAVMRDPSLSRDARTLYAILVSYASISSDDRGVWPANATLAGQLGCSIDSTRRYLRELADAGLVTITGRRDKDGGQTSNLITLHDRNRLAGVAAAPPPPPQPRHAPPGTTATPPLAPVLPEREPLEREPRNEKERARSARAARRAPSSTLSEGWAPNDTHAVYARTHGLLIEDEAFTFRSHAEATGRRMVNWDAAFTTWLSKSRRPAGQVTTIHGQRQRPAARPDGIVDAAEAARASNARARQVLDGDSWQAVHNRMIREQQAAADARKEAQA